MKRGNSASCAVGKMRCRDLEIASANVITIVAKRYNFSVIAFDLGSLEGVSKHNNSLRKPSVVAILRKGILD